MFFYPILVKNEFSWVYTATLILAISVSSFARYYFGVVDRLLLTADQHGYIQYNAQTLTLILNTIACVVLINLNCSIHTVKLTTSLIYLLRPVFLRYYVNAHYKIDRHITYEEEPIQQKWNGVAQHIAAVVLDGTGNIILTAFSTLANVSIYSVYNLVQSGVRRLLISSTNGFQSLLGELWARQEMDELHRTFGWIEWFLHTVSTFIFGCTAMLIVPFVAVYTQGVHDANYIQPVFALIFTAATAGHCYRLPYNIMILAGGHYKQTQKCYIIAVILNLSISIPAVYYFGLIGIATGALVAMVYQTVWMAYYDSKNLLRWPFKSFLKQIAVDVFTFVVCWFIARHFSMRNNTISSWILLALETSLVWIVMMFSINMVFYNKYATSLLKKFKLF